MGITALAIAVAAAVPGGVATPDKPAIGPAPAWVRPVALPPLDGKPDQAAARLLLQDQQVDLEPGRQTRYAETAFRIQTPQGLSAGNLSFAWNPDTEVLTVHKLLIRRGDQVIDILASGQTFTVVRREANLDNAMLDGVLTATIQPEGLQVGDIVDFALSIAHSDPALKTHIEQIGGGWNGVPISRAHLRVQWPAAVQLQLRETGGLPPLKTVRKDGVASVELTLDALQPIAPPKLAPMRYALKRLVEMSDFASWSDLAGLMAPLYVKAAALPAQGKVQSEIDRIAAQSADPKTRAQAALDLVQDRVRYVFLGMNDGGLVPADAETTWSRRFGDCKGKTVLLLALLHGLGIAAQPVIVSSALGDGMDQRLPMIGLFDHVLVRATIAGKTYWLDGTRTGDTSLDLIRTPGFRWGLPLAPGAALVAMTPPPPARPLLATSVRIDASAGISLPAPFHAETVWRDDAALALNLGIANLTPDVLENQLKDYWRKQYDFVDVKSASASYDPVRREERFVADGDATMDWSSGWYETDGLDVGYKADFSRDPGLDQDAPFAVPYPLYTSTSETILLPANNHFTIDHPEDVDQAVAGIAYHRHVSIAGNRFAAEQSERSNATEFPAADAPAAQRSLRALADKTVNIKKPDDYRATDAEAAAARTKTPTSAAEFIKRGNMLLDRGSLDAAAADFTSALALDPKSAEALAGRGVSYAWKRENALAAKDLDAAAAIDPRETAVYHGRALIALQNDAPAEAIAELDKAIAIWPQDVFALSKRAVLYRDAGDDEKALADADAIVRQSPQAIGAYLMRADIERHQGKLDLAAGEAAALSAANPDSDLAHVTAATIYARCGRQAEAMREFDLALGIAKRADIYVDRANARPASDLAGRQADIDLALGLDPKSARALEAKADLQDERRDYPGAVATLTLALTAAPKDPGVLIRRGIESSRAGQPAPSAADLAAAHALIGSSPGMLNNICWMEAAAGVALESALADCNAALAKKPDSADYLDSRALVLMRLGRTAEALADYNHALKARPWLATSLYGRAVLESRTGDVAGARADVHAATGYDPDIAAAFQRFGIPPVRAGAAPAKTGAAARTGNAQAD